MKYKGNYILQLLKKKVSSKLNMNTRLEVTHRNYTQAP